MRFQLLAFSLQLLASRYLFPGGWATRRRDAGEPEPDYEGWFCLAVEEELADTSTEIPNEVVVGK